MQNGDTALHIAAAMGRRKLTRILLEAGCDKSLKNKVRKCSSVRARQ
jgi:ankyrin repeat domain-containing protein 6